MTKLILHFGTRRNIVINHKHTVKSVIDPLWWAAAKGIGTNHSKVVIPNVTFTKWMKKGKWVVIMHEKVIFIRENQPA